METKGSITERFPFLSIAILQSRIAWSIRFRWVAVLGFFFATYSTKYIFEVELPFEPIWRLLIALAIINSIYLIILKVVKEFSFLAEFAFLTIHILLDLIILTLLINLTGGVENPIYLFYLFHVVLSSIVLPRWFPYIVSSIVVGLFASLLYAEYNQIIEHHCILYPGSHDNLVLNALVLTIFTITVYVTTYICTTFMKIFRNSKRQIDELNKKLIKADEQKTQFFQYTSHELKSPIIAVKSSIDGVLANFGEALPEKPFSVLSRASVRSGQMLEIIKELLDLTQNRNLLPQVYTEQIDVHAILKNTVEQEKPTAESRNIEIECAIEDSKPIITGKINDFEKVFTNLISNAIRYNVDNGKVKIISKVIAKAVLEITVSDSGIGIAKEDYKNIFSEFYRSKNAKEMVNFGTGLGLSVVKQIIENYSGSIQLESEIGKGTTFTIILPIFKLNG